MIILILVLSACSEEPAVQPSHPTQPAKPSQPSEVPLESEPRIDLDSYSEQTKSAYNYLLQENIQVQELVDENEEMNINWEIICNDQNVITLNAFLHSEISKASERNSYGTVIVKSSTFLLNDNATVAEVFFIKDRIIGAVQYPKNDISKDHKEYFSLKGENMEEILQISYPLWEGQSASAPAIYNIVPKNAAADGFGEIVHIQELDANRYILVCRSHNGNRESVSGNNTNEARLYIYDLRDNTDFYSGITYRDNMIPIRRSKQLEDNRYALILSDKILIIDGQSIQTLIEIKYPEDDKIYKDDFDISADGKSIVFATRNGLTLSDINFENHKILVNSKTSNDPSGMDWEIPRYPQFSPDSKKIMYRMVGYEWVIGTGVINIDGTDNRFYESKEEERSFIEWYDGEHLYSDSPSYSDSDHPVLLNVNSGEQIELVNEKQEGNLIQFYLGKDDKFFYYETNMRNDSNIRFGYYYINTGVYDLTIEIPQIYLGSTDYNFDNKAFIFTASKYPVKSKLFILTGI